MLNISDFNNIINSIDRSKSLLVEYAREWTRIAIYIDDLTFSQVGCLFLFGFIDIVMLYYYIRSKDIINIRLISLLFAVITMLLSFHYGFSTYDEPRIEEYSLLSGSKILNQDNNKYSAATDKLTKKIYYEKIVSSIRDFESHRDDLINKGYKVYTKGSPTQSKVIIDIDPPISNFLMGIFFAFQGFLIALFISQTLIMLISWRLYVH